MIPRKKWVIAWAYGWVVFHRPKIQRIWFWLGEPMDILHTAWGPFESENEAKAVLSHIKSTPE